MNEELALLLTYDPGELSNGISAYVIEDGKQYDGKYVLDNLLDFTPSVSFELLPPVTKYISPTGKNDQYVVIEQKPTMLVVDDDLLIPVPWNYFLIHIDRFHNFKVCWLFRDDQLFIPDEPMGASWLTKRSFYQCGMDLNEYIKVNHIHSGRSFILSSMISGALSRGIVKHHFSPDNHGAIAYAQMVAVAEGGRRADPENLFQSLSTHTIQDTIDWGIVPDLDINHIHREAVKFASDAVPSLTEMILSGKTDRTEDK
jgi:hypothetical protein